jgi:hypothetical protein
VTEREQWIYIVVTLTCYAILFGGWIVVAIALVRRFL